jgi:hypothetical protein
LRVFCCRFGSLYGELARFVLRLLGFRPKDKQHPEQQQQQQQQQQQGPQGAQQQQPVGPQGRPAAKPRGMPGMPVPAARPAANSGSSGGGQWDSLWTK